MTLTTLPLLGVFASHVITDSVAVTDLVRHKTIILQAGQSYLAQPRK